MAAFGEDELDQVLEEDINWNPEMARSSLYWGTRQHREHPLTASERRLAGLIAPPQQAQQYLVKQKRPKGERHRELLDIMRREYPEDDPEDMLRRARIARGKVLKADPNHVPRPKPVYTPREELLHKRHRLKPNVMTKPRYLPLLQDENIRGDYDASAIKNPQWMNKTPQRMKPDDYNRMARDFAEMVGIVGLRPEYDRRLLTEPSARATFGNRADKFTYTLEDMDNDPNTPGTLLIREKEGDKRLVAAGGYRLPRASAGQTERLLKDIHYYGSNPTKDDRKAQTRREFYATMPMFYPKAPAKMLGPVVDFITEKLAQLNIVPPSRGVPCYITLVANARINPPRPAETRILYKVSPIAWNCIIKFMAKLYLYYYVFPEFPDDDDDDNLPLAMKAVGNLKLQSNIRNINTIPLPATISNNPATHLRYRQLYAWSHKTLFNPDLETAILRDKRVQDEIKHILSTHGGDADYWNTTLTGLLNVVCGQMCRINLPIIDKLFHNPNLEGFTLEQRIFRWLVDGTMYFRFAPRDTIAGLQRAEEGKTVITLPITTLAEADLLAAYEVQFNDGYPYMEPGPLPPKPTRQPRVYRAGRRNIAADDDDDDDDDGYIPPAPPLPTTSSSSSGGVLVPVDANGNPILPALPTPQ